jgi:hypothetical protein
MFAKKRRGTSKVNDCTQQLLRVTEWPATAEKGLGGRDVSPIFVQIPRTGFSIAFALFGIACLAPSADGAMAVRTMDCEITDVDCTIDFLCDWDPEGTGPLPVAVTLDGPGIAAASDQRGTEWGSYKGSRVIC